MLGGHGLNGKTEGCGGLEQPLLAYTKKCPHLEVEERLLGKKRKVKALVCKDCGLILQIEGEKANYGEA